METKKRVLVVDNEPGILKVLGIQLKLHGYEAITTVSGKKAIELVRTRERGLPPAAGRPATPDPGPALWLTFH
jgi:DNA-binding NtrC family response regulator